MRVFLLFALYLITLGSFFSIFFSRVSEESVCQKQIYQIKEVTLTCSLKNHVEASLSKLSKVEVNKLLLDYQSKFDETLIRGSQICLI